MPRSLELVLPDGESLVKAPRQVKAKAQQPNTPQDDIGREIQRRSINLTASEVHPAKRQSRGPSKKLPAQSALLDTAIQSVGALPSELQEVIAETIFASLREQANPSSRRFQELVDAKYTRGLTSAESSELARLEAGFCDSEEAFYAPILARVKAQAAPVKKRGAS